MTNDNYRPKNAPYATYETTPQQSPEYHPYWTEEKKGAYITLNHPLISIDYEFK